MVTVLDSGLFVEVGDVIECMLENREYACVHPCVSPEQFEGELEFSVDGEEYSMDQPITVGGSFDVEIRYKDDSSYLGRQIGFYVEAEESDEQPSEKVPLRDESEDVETEANP